MTTTIARPIDVSSTGRAVLIRAGYLAKYRGHTRDHYLMVIDQWYEWCYTHGLDPIDIKRAHIESRSGLATSPEMWSTTCSQQNTATRRPSNER